MELRHMKIGLLMENTIEQMVQQESNELMMMEN